MGFDRFVVRTGIKVYRGGGRKCWTCSLPPALLKEVEELRQRSPAVPFPVISEYLVEEHKIRIRPGTIQKHFADGHSS